MIPDNPTPGEFGWIRVLTPNAKSTNRFYTRLFGWEAFETEVNGKPYTMYKKGGKLVGGMLEIPEGNPNNLKPHWMCYITVSNMEETMTMVEQEGGKRIVDPVDMPGLGRFGMIQDPTGVLVGLYQPARA